MTISEAKKFTESIRNGLHETGKDFPYRDEVIPVAKEALNMAIRSFDAWEKVKAEIEASINFANESVEEAIYKCGVESALEIIDKHLKGVSDE